MTEPATMAEKLWRRHVITGADGGSDLLYIDLHLLHEVTSPQAFDGLRQQGRQVRCPEQTMAVEDHNVPTDGSLADAVGQAQMDTLRANCEAHGIELYPLGHARQGIIHVTAPELGLIQPGMTVVCGDSHTSTHGAFGALAYGVGTSEVEHVLATQTLPAQMPRQLAVEFQGTMPLSATAKDLALAVMARLGTRGGRGHVIEYRGQAVRGLSMEARMTLCNMSIEAGARAGLIAPDDVTIDYLRDRPFAPPPDLWDKACADWLSLATDEGAAFDTVVRVDVSELAPYVTWGVNPSQAVPIDGVVPDPDVSTDEAQKNAARRALEYMGLAPGQAMRDIAIDTVFVGSCTNSRIEDLRTVAAVLARHRVSSDIRMLIVPGSMEVRRQAEAEGLSEIFVGAGAEWRRPGCSICLGMNPDRLSGQQRVASTSNRNFEGRQGDGVRTHLVSPAVAAATAVVGRFATPNDLNAGDLTLQR